MSDAHANHDAAALFQNDEQLKSMKEQLVKYEKLASDDAVTRVVSALKEKHAAKVIVVETKEEALKAAIAAIPEGATISAGGSVRNLIYR